jgi:FSR family fosmidomycin resistance protein-like MFS transporter
MGPLAAGHACVDACQGAVPALLPFMIGEHGLSVTAASALVLAATAASTVVQPLFGAYSDRAPAAWLLPAGVSVACAGVAAAAVAPSYPLIFVSVLLSGLGVAAYHPEGSRYANYVSGAERATGMSYYSLGGNVGFALGPVLVTPLVLLFGLAGGLFFLVPAAAMGAVLRAELSHLARFKPRPAAARETASRTDDVWRGFVQLLIVIALRSFAFYTLLALVPLYFLGALETSEATANAALTTMLVLGAVGTLVGGRLADRLGRTPVLVASLALQPPLLLAMTAVDTVPAMVLVGAFGFVAISSFSVTVVMSQEYLPSRLGLASGFSLGAAIGIGGLAAPLFGLIGDELGLGTAVRTLAILPALGAAIALLLPLAPASKRNVAAARAARAPAAGA